jgi:hypothetical protein
MLTLGAREEAPAWTVGNLARQVFGDWPPSDDRLEAEIGHWVASLTEEHGAVETAPTGPAYEVSDLREEGSGPADFDFEVSLDEELADEVPVDELAAGLRAAAGVLDVHVEDQEVLLVRAPEWDEHRLVRWLDGNLRRP